MALSIYDPWDSGSDAEFVSEVENLVDECGGNSHFRLLFKSLVEALPLAC